MTASADFRWTADEHRTGLGRRIDAAPLTSLDDYVEAADRSVLITSGSAAMMTPGDSGFASALLGPGSVIALDGGAAPGRTSQLCCVSRVEARVLSFDLLEEEPGAGRRFVEAELRTLSALHRQAQQTAACVLRHPVPHRVAGWLLALHQGTGSDELRLGQASLARLIGVQRTTITASLAELVRHGAVRVRRNRLIVLNPARLAARSCGCVACID